MFMVCGLTLFCTPGTRVLYRVPFPWSTHTSSFCGTLIKHFLGCPTPHPVSMAYLSAIGICGCLGDLDSTGEISRVAI